MGYAILIFHYRSTLFWDLCTPLGTPVAYSMPHWPIRRPHQTTGGLTNLLVASPTYCAFMDLLEASTTYWGHHPPTGGITDL